MCLNPIKVVITGGPCVGKTALINHLNSLEFLCFPEVIREFTLAETKQKEGIPLQSNPIVFAEDALGFNSMLIKQRTAQYNMSLTKEDPVAFFDRGLPDVIAYMDFFNQKVPDHFNTACKDHIYDHVFILPPWKDIYIQDEGRFETFEEAIHIHDALVTRYSKFEYTPVSVPKDSIVNRVAFILKHLNL